MSLSIESTVTLHNGIKMPMLGFGTFKCPNESETIDVIQCAIDAGYRHIDTAMVYDNEEIVGKAVRECGVAREDIFLTTKCWNTDLREGPDAVLKAFDASLDRLGLDYVDLYLVHWPTGDFVSYWKSFEKIYESGRAKAIGVSNFLISHLDKLIPTCNIKPMVDQVECHPQHSDPPLREYCKKNQIAFEAWSPLAQGKFKEIDLIMDLAAKYGKTGAQMILRWNLQSEIVTIPKSMTPSRIRENADIFDFEISPEDMDAITALDGTRRVGPHPDEITF